MKHPPVDASAALVSALVAVLGATGVVSKLGLTGDQVATILASLLGLAAAVRAWLAPSPVAGA